MDELTVKVTRYSFVQTAEGLRVAYTYSKIDKAGNVVQSNIRGSYIDDSADTATFMKKMNQAILSHIE